MNIPFEPTLFGVNINVHLILEYLAFFVAFRYYVWLKRRSSDPISSSNRLPIILGAALGALLGSRLMGFFENPILPTLNFQNVLILLNTKSIMGGLFGGLIGVEITKKIVGEKESSGDLFTFPIILGIIIGRIGCFLSGTKEFTYGHQTDFFFGMDLGDGIPRHPIALYEIVFLSVVLLILHLLQSKTKNENGLQFKLFMLTYFAFRFFIEFLKPNTFLILNLSSIQWLCIICWMYYLPTLKRLLSHAY